MPTDTPEQIAAEVLPCLHKRYGQYSCQPEEFAFLCVNCERRPAVADAIRREREARCQSHPAVKANLCRECLDHAAETGAYL